MNPRLSPLAPLASLLLAGCGGGFVIGGAGVIDCEGPMAALTGRLGFPEQVDRRLEGGLHIDTFFYVRSGIAVAFTWGSDLSCEQREFSIDASAPRSF